MDKKTNVKRLAELLAEARRHDRRIEAASYKTSAAMQIEMSTFIGNFQRQAKYLEDKGVLAVDALVEADYQAIIKVCRNG